MSSAPAEAYRVRLGRLESLRNELDRRDARVSHARLGVFFAGLALAIFWWRDALSIWWGVVAVAVFLALVVWHDRVIRARHEVVRSIAFYRRAVARIEDTWPGSGSAGDRFRDDEHLYANDLDLFGTGSLFELLSIARTRAGEETLAAWLKRPADPAQIVARQEAVAELAPALDLREALARAGEDVAGAVDGDALVAWAEGGAFLRPAWLRWVAAALTTAAVVAGVLGLVTSNYVPFAVALGLEFLYFVPLRPRIMRALHAADDLARDLGVLAHALECLERHPVSASRLVELRRELDTAGLPASVSIRRLQRLVELHDWQHNQFFAPVAAAFLWGTHLAWAIEAWRRTHGPRVAVWLRTVGELEALSSLSAYRYEHPDDTWPEIVEGPAEISATALGHPLIPASRMIRNDVALAGTLRLLVVSGSNMSGKSTFLRTIGVNAVLALAGAPVRAAALRITPVAIGATLRIQDSLQQGKSRFYAEITRVRAIADLTAGPLPLLFLLDEIFQGTNSHDRLVGASGVLTELVERGAIGLITTHDMALTAIADRLGPRAANVHFEDRFEDGELQFDYRLKPGPVTRSNAIALMRAIGLQVDGDSA